MISDQNNYLAIYKLFFLAPSHKFGNKKSLLRPALHPKIQWLHLACCICNDFNFNFINPEYINISLSTPNTCFSLTAMSGSEEMFSRKARDRLSGALTSAVEGTDILDGLPDLTAGLDSPLRRIVKYV